jgi:hypothetical protein
VQQRLVPVQSIEWNACPASWTIVSTSRCTPAAFMKMKGLPVCSSMYW